MIGNGSVIIGVRMVSKTKVMWLFWTKFRKRPGPSRQVVVREFTNSRKATSLGGQGELAVRQASRNDWAMRSN